MNGSTGIPLHPPPSPYEGLFYSTRIVATVQPTANIGIGA